MRGFRIFRLEPEKVVGSGPQVEGLSFQQAIGVHSPLNPAVRCQRGTHHVEQCPSSDDEVGPPAQEDLLLGSPPRLLRRPRRIHPPHPPRPALGVEGLGFREVQWFKGF